MKRQCIDHGQFLSQCLVLNFGIQRAVVGIKAGHADNQSVVVVAVHGFLPYLLWTVQESVNGLNLSRKGSCHATDFGQSDGNAAAAADATTFKACDGIIVVLVVMDLLPRGSVLNSQSSGMRSSIGHGVGRREGSNGLKSKKRDSVDRILL